MLPKAVLAFSLGLLGLVLTVTAPFAIVLGIQATREIDRAAGAWSGRSLAVAGKWLGILVCAIIAIGVVIAAGLAIWAVASLYFAFS